MSVFRLQRLKICSDCTIHCNLHNFTPKLGWRGGIGMTLKKTPKNQKLSIEAFDCDITIELLQNNVALLCSKTGDRFGKDLDS